MNRAAWQEECVARNFTDGVAPFLPPVHLEEAAAWKYFASSRERNFDDFLSKRNGQIDALDQELRAILPQAHAALRTGMQLAVAQGYVPAYALERIEPTFTQTAIQAVDQSILGDDVAGYGHDKDLLIVAPDIMKYGLLQAIVHELGGHKMSGGTFRRLDDGTIVRVRRGFVNYRGITADPTEADSPSVRHFGLDEAVQSHLAHSYLFGEIDVADPDMRSDPEPDNGLEGISFYHLHRKLLAAFLIRSGGIIDLKAITRGSFEDTDELRGTTMTDRRTMVRQAQTAYGPGAYRKLSVLFDAIDFEDLSWGEIEERVHPPQLNDNGRVIEPGSIDISGFSFYNDEENA